MQRAVRRELRVHHVARQAEHHRPPGPGVQDQQHHGVGADAFAADRPVAAEEQDAHLLAPAPRVLLADAARRGGRAVLGEERLDQVGLRGGVRASSARPAAPRPRRRAPRQAPARPTADGAARRGRSPDVRRQHAQRPHARPTPSTTTTRAQPGGVGGQLDERVHVAQRAEQVDRPADERAPAGRSRCSRPVQRKPGAGQHGAEQGHAEGAAHRAGATLAAATGRPGAVAPRTRVHESQGCRTCGAGIPGPETRVGRELSTLDRRGWGCSTSAGPLVLDGGLSTALEQQGADLGGRAVDRAAAGRRAASGSRRRTGPSSTPGARVATTASYQASVEGLVAAGYDADGGPAADHAQRDDRPRGARRARRRHAGAARGRVGRAVRRVPRRRVGVHRPVRRPAARLRDFHGAAARAAGRGRARPAGRRDHPRRRRGRGAGRAARRGRPARVVQLLGEAATAPTPASCSSRRTPCSSGCRSLVAAGVNCSDQADVLGAVEDRRRRDRACPPSPTRTAAAAGTPTAKTWAYGDPLDLDLVPGWLAAGVRLVGGCCGNGPADIAGPGGDRRRDDQHRHAGLGRLPRVTNTQQEVATPGPRRGTGRPTSCCATATPRTSGRSGPRTPSCSSSSTAGSRTSRSTSGSSPRCPSSPSATCERFTHVDHVHRVAFVVTLKKRIIALGSYEGDDVRQGRGRVPRRGRPAGPRHRPAPARAPRAGRPRAGDRAVRRRGAARQRADDPDLPRRRLPPGAATSRTA